MSHSTTIFKGLLTPTPQNLSRSGTHEERAPFLTVPKASRYGIIFIERATDLAAFDYLGLKAVAGRLLSKLARQATALGLAIYAGRLASRRQVEHPEED